MKFKTMKLSELTVDGRGHYGIGASAVEKSDELYAYLRITDIYDDGTLNKAGLKSVDDPDAEKYLLKPNDIVFARTGNSVGKSYFYDERDGSFVYAGFLIKFSLDPAKVNPRFVKYYCQSQRYKNWVASFSTGSTRGNINAQTYGDMEILTPCRAQQDFLVEILSALDDKIELNRRINANLEQQAFAIFANLLENACSGECRLAEIVEFGPKYTLCKNNVARCVEMKQLSTIGSFPLGWETQTYQGGTRFTNGDTLLARITPCLENGKAAYVNFLEEGEIAFGSTEYIVMRSRGVYPAEFFYCLARNPEFVDYAIKNLNGTSGRQRVSSETLGEYTLPRLSEKEMAIFRNAVSPSFEKIRNNGLENIALAAVRDALLPRLMSGEIDVDDVKF
ncbi:MAG: restriction endonuclease subunit S [Thermoguttaceae bacterium]|nr:restriction endonuclease subunit S [Thermoguttaceae bacterium]